MWKNYNIPIVSSYTRYETEIKFKATSTMHQDVIENASTVSTNTVQVDEIANVVNTVKRVNNVHMEDILHLQKSVSQLPELTREGPLPAKLPELTREEPLPAKPHEPKVKSTLTGVVQTMVTE